jgi:hypothetical protein
MKLPYQLPVFRELRDQSSVKTPYRMEFVILFVPDKKEKLPHVQLVEEKMCEKPVQFVEINNVNEFRRSLFECLMKILFYWQYDRTEQVFEKFGKGRENGEKNENFHTDKKRPIDVKALYHGGIETFEKKRIEKI